MKEIVLLWFSVDSFAWARVGGSAQRLAHRRDMRRHTHTGTGEDINTENQRILSDGFGLSRPGCRRQATVVNAAAHRHENRRIDQHREMKEIVLLWFSVWI
jgi:hypothetical protein